MLGSDVLFAGATGLIGSLALPGMLQRASAGAFRVHAVSRRALPLQHAQLNVIQAALGGPVALAALRERLDQDGVELGTFVCALGTTLRTAGSRAAFAAVDRDLVLALAALARDYGARHAIVVSSIGASASAGNFYLRVKGEMEAGVAESGFDRVDLLHPGLLLGDRGNERRPGERIAQALAPIFNPLLLGPLAQFGAIEARLVADAVVALTAESSPGLTRWRNRELRQLANRQPML